MTSEFTEQRVREMIADGEGQTVEYKSSLRWDYRGSCVNKDLTKMVIRTLAAFLNARGGSLIIGVNDDGALLDLKDDIATLPKKSLDGFELALRGAVASYLGEEIDPYVTVEFASIDNKYVAIASCAAHTSPVYVRDGQRREFCVRSGNLTRSLDVAAAVAYIQNHWKTAVDFGADQLKAVIADALAAAQPGKSRAAQEGQERNPLWLNLATRRVLDLFLASLSRAHGWKRLNIVSPWISELSGPFATLSFDQLLVRLQRDTTTAYIVTRPPEEEWHQRAIQRLADTGRANIALLPDLHVKLFTAQTLQTSFAMLGSANFTAQSLVNREIGVLVKATGDGKALVRSLDYEAAEIYRSPGRQLICQAQL